MERNNGKFMKGESKGRPVGTPNKINKTVREAVLNVFNRLQDETLYPRANLMNWAESEPTEFYKIAAKLIPTEITGTLKHVIKARVVDDHENDEDAGDGSTDS